MGQYDDIIDLQHPTFAHYKHMSMRERAAQFMPFAALRGYETCIQEAGRYVEPKRVLSAERIRVLTDRLDLISRHVNARPFVRIEYFVADKTKQGGTYACLEARVRRVDYYARRLLLEDRTAIAFDDLYRIEGEPFDAMRREEDGS